MFKIIENGDGSTSVFDKETGRLLCRVPKNSSAVAVGKPLLRQDIKPVVRKKHKSDLKRSSPCLPKEYSPVEKKKRIEAWADCASTSDRTSFVSSSGSETSDEITDECIDQHCFLKTFDLIDSSKLQCKDMTALKRTFPLRKISRLGPVLPGALSSVLRPFDDLELCSPLGLLFCQLKPKLGSQALEQAAKKYEKYCKISVLTPHPNLTLRQRESVKYGITFRPTRNRLGLVPSSHLYAFNARERRARYIQLVTGLNGRSRALRKSCKTLRVFLRRLTTQEIKYHTAVRLKQTPVVRLRSISKDVVSDDDDCVVIAEVIRTGTAYPQHIAQVRAEESRGRKIQTIYIDGESLWNAGCSFSENQFHHVQLPPGLVKDE